MNATLIQQPALRLITARSKQFPEGNREAFTSIESHLKTLKGRRFYGLVYEKDGALDYHAGLLPDSEIEERRFAALGFTITEIAAGPCARLKMLDWTSKTDQIGPSFGAMIRQYGIDPSRPQMEYYRSLTELHLLLPVPASSETKPC
ncbi:hypothetical protein [Brevifollis gellanilyticus]|uniref:Bacterial transcription activator effector binding domain-containing protein n=1 Tax=Brevifollis gellanilyticus TaxID=748831 RepID=A0A512M2K6_9BACT|nr:hypothetical protein [Brevifollis gellanilyticus]GEP40974.1 hypothetical protein BGE01nite_02650 [Brevifollis gellanilyticus]